MCRWLFSAKPIGMKHGSMIRFLTLLRHSQGGHGEGLWCPGVGVTKPVTIPQSASLLRDVGGLWHTRLTSSGIHHPELIHPFQFDRTILAHNGTEFNADIVASYLTATTGELWSDTRVIASLLARTGQWERIPARLRPDSGVWVYTVNGGATWTIRVESGSCEYDPVSGLWASELPYSMFRQAYRVKAGIYNPATDIPEKPNWFAGMASQVTGFSDSTTSLTYSGPGLSPGKKNPPENVTVKRKGGASLLVERGFRFDGESTRLWGDDLVDND